MFERKATTIWVNATMILLWKNKSTGIQRVEREIIRQLLTFKMENISIEFFYVVGYKLRYLSKETINSLMTGTMSQKIPHFRLYLRRFFRKIVSNQRFNFILPFVLRVDSNSRSIVAVLKSFFSCLQGKNEHRSVKMSSSDIVMCFSSDANNNFVEIMIKIKEGAPNVRVVQTCMDLIPIFKPNLFGMSNLWAKRIAKYFYKYVSVTDVMLCISESTSRDLRKYCEIERLRVPAIIEIMLGVADVVVSPEKALLANFSLKENGYILFVSSLEKRKSHETIYRAYISLKKEGMQNLPKVVFVGMKSVGINELMRDLEQDPEIQGDFILLHNVSDVELSMLYKNCLFTVFPSLYEGWGLPIAESLANGKFCVAGTGSSLSEVGGKFCDYIDPWNIPAWTEVLKKYILNPNELQARSELIRQQYVSPRWSDTAEPIKQLLQELTA